MTDRQDQEGTVFQAAASSVSLKAPPAVGFWEAAATLASATRMLGA
jgi:hypothetical protein